MTDPGARPARISVVAGSTAGIGLAIAERLAASGQVVASVSRNPLDDAALEHLRGLGAADVDHHVADLARPGSADEVAAWARARFGGIDTWISNATGDATLAPFVELDEDAWTRGIDHKLHARVRELRAAVGAIRGTDRGGTIVVMVSDAGRVGTPGEAIPAAGSGAMIALTKSLARELARWQIAINAVAITLTDGSRGQERIARDAFGRRIFAKARERAPLGLPDARDVADAVCYLAGSRHVTGQTLSVNGGLSTL